MKDIKSSVVLKAVCYIMIPILVVLIIINSISIALSIEYEEDMRGYTDYFNTQRFASDCLSSIYQATRNIRYIKQDSMYNMENTLIIATQEAQQETTDENSANQETINYELGNYLGKRIIDIMIVTTNGNIYTNLEKTVKTDSYEKLQSYITNKDRKWEMVKGTIITNLEKMNYENIAYNSMFEYIQDNATEIYVAVRDENSNNSSIYVDKTIYEMVAKTYQTAPIVLTISSIALLVACAYIIFSIGHKKGKEELHTNALDRVPLEILTIVSGTILFLEAALFEIIVQSSSSRLINILIPLLIIWGLLVYITLAISGVTVIRRIKAKVFFKNSLSYRVIHYLKGGASNLLSDISKNTGRTIKLVIIVGSFTLISIILAFWAINSFFSFLLLLVFWWFCFRKVLKEMSKLVEIRDKIKHMYNGEIEEKLEEDKFTGEMKQVVHELNDISGGLSNAIEQGLKSERLKTELITNVSHDIKTPLTSIINYVDLLKKEKIPNQKAQEYLEVLDNKSQRLKKLTEDLVEASKASSGNIKLNMEKLNVKELIKQVSGEFEDKFEEKGLQIVESVPKEEIYIQADSRYMYRVMENMYTNIIKYALENSRVYVDVIQKENTIEIALKNISKDKLNISVDELMQRFVRGDTARTTEGSGLGISIARSLTELQKGKFDLYLDGDLFKVVIQFPNI